MKKPNILMIVTDQHRYDCIGYANKYPVKTPNLDKLASEGMCFHNAYTTTPTCCPARQTLLNGRRCEAFGALWNFDITLKIPALEPSEYTWSRELKEYGYNLDYIGKWHVHPTCSPIDYGFDSYYSYSDYFDYRAKKYPDIKYNMNWFGDIDEIPLEDSPTHILANVAMGKMAEHNASDKPWHIRLDFSEPHLPCNPCKEFVNLYKPQEIEKWGGFDEEFNNKPYIQKQNVLSWGLEDKNWEEWSECVARYYAIISQTDDAIGKVMEKLRELGQENNTIVIYTTDHGDMCGSHRMIDKHCVMYDDIVRVPLIIKWKDKIKENSVSNEFVYNILDIQPTILEACGLAPKPFFHGRSLMNMLSGNTEDDWRKEVVCTYNGQQFGLYCQRMIRNEKVKYIWNLTDVDELYDMQKDPYELKNLIKDEEYKEILTEMRLKLYKLLKKDDDYILRTSFLDEQLLKNRKI